MFELKLWQEILLYVIVLVDIFIFVKLSQFKINGISLIKLHWRILIAVIFPLIFVVALMFGVALIGIILIVLLILFIMGFFRKKKFRFRIRTF